MSRWRKFISSCSPAVLAISHIRTAKMKCGVGAIKKLTIPLLGFAGYDLPTLLTRRGSKKQQKKQRKNRKWPVTIQRADCPPASEKERVQLHGSRERGTNGARREAFSQFSPRPARTLSSKVCSQHGQDQRGHMESSNCQRS